MMLLIQEKVKIYLYLEPVDMRKAVNGLSAIVSDEFSSSPTSGNVFIFFNKSKNRLKCLFWDKNGFVLYYKRIEKRNFIVGQLSGNNVEITVEQMRGLLAGFDITLLKQFPEIDYNNFY